MKGNILDLVLTNAAGNVHSVTDEGRLGKSDHVMVRIQLQGQPAKQSFTCSPDWNKADWDGMKDELKDTDWYTTLRDMNTEESWTAIKVRLNRLTEEFVPVRKRRPPGRPVWMNREILRAMGKKRRLWKVQNRSQM